MLFRVGGVDIKAVAIIGSRNPDGQTGMAADSLLDAMVSRGIDCEKFYLPEMKLELCRQCGDDCWGQCKSEGRCIIDDDYGMLVDSINKADIVIFATPVYFWDLSESLKCFLDRLRRSTMYMADRVGIKGKRAVGICVAGGSGFGSVGCVSRLEDVLMRCGFDVIDLIPVRRQLAGLKYKVLQMTGEWIAENIIGQ